ncbi:MAP kinase [Boletus coccyginus]|nr:MAP kinase [Boletus coccyginus]
MSEDTKSITHRGRRLLVLANPDPGDSSSSDDDRRRRYHLPQSSHSSLHQPPSSIPPPSPHRAVNKPANPTLTTDLPHHISSSHSNPTLSSPSSQSSNAVESTPPPSTPGQAAPPDIATTLFNDDGSAVNDRSDLPQPSRIQKMADKLWKPRRGSSHRPKESECSLHSPTPSCHLPSSERVIMVTHDCHAFTAVDVTPANSAAFVWERIFTELKIPDEDQSSGFAIYRTQVNRAAVGEALANDSLLRLIREQGDGEGNLKFLVCHPHARVHEPPLPTSPVRSIPPPPPVFGPLIPRSKVSQPSRQESISSEDPTGYEPSAVSDDFDDADNRSTMRPRQYLPNLSGTFTASPAQTMQYHVRQPPSPVSARIPYSSSADRRRQLDLNTGTVMQPSHSAPALEDTLVIPRRQLRRGSNAEEREKAPRDSERVMEPADAERSRTLPNGLVDKAKTPRSGGVGASASDEMIVREQESPILRRSSRSSPRRRGVSRADTSGPPRPAQPRRTGARVAPPGSYIVWKAPDPVSGSSPSRGLRNARSTEMLQNLPPPTPLRSTLSRPQLPPEPHSGPPSRPHRPLPPTQGSTIDNGNVEANTPTRSLPQPQSSPPTSASPATYLSHSQEPHPRPHSASPAQQRLPSSNDVSGHDALRDRDAQRPLPSHHHQSHSASNSVSKFGDAPFKEDGFSGNTLPLSLRAGPYSSSVRPETPPRSPVSAATSRPSTSASSSTLAYTSGTIMDSRQNSSSSGQETLSESTVRPGEGDKVIWEFKARVASQQLAPSIDGVSSSDDYATATKDLWSRRPLSQIVREDKLASPKSSPRPTLEVITHSTNNNIRGVPSNLAVPDYVPQPQPQPRLRDPRPRAARDGHKSTFEEYTWAHRPPPEDVYDRLEEFFPEHDLDKPVIEANSGGTSPTAADPAYGITPNDRERINVRGKKSIRIVAEEHKKRLDRTSRAESSYGNLLRRSTKLWGGHVEEVTTSQKKPTISKPTVDASSGGPRPIFKWVRGELIGKGTYGRVYLALNATTGEMIAVKQVEMPTTASDKNDSRQASYVQALKMESETLKDLDHPHIVAYLGFEETPNFLSIFLEYVPGGSVGSCLRDHGKFDEEVTKSFTAQILDGLAYLHSKNIIHRDLKSDNILVEKTGICKISDFGVSKRADDDQAAYTAMQGTVFWMAPEVIGSQKGKGYNSKVDIWSVGCVVLEMWAGRRPWPDEDFFTVMFKVSHEGKSPPIPPDVILSDLAVDFKDRCFAVHPDARASTAELIQHPYLKLPDGWVFNDFK